MATPAQLEALSNLYKSALLSGHIWPEYAACEAIVESAWMTSILASEYNGVFGQKCPIIDGAPTPPPNTLSVVLPTKEYIHGQWITINAAFLWFPTLAAAFQHRMALLTGDPAYAAAIHAADGPSYVVEVSKVWATSPTRAQTVIEIHDAHAGLFAVKAPLTPLP